MLSKTDYMLGMECEKALWLVKHHPELVPDVDVMLQRRFDIGNEVQEYARQLFPSGKMVAGGDIEYAALRTKEFSEKHRILFEATAMVPNQAFCRIDIMEREENAWNLIEIKSATEAKDNYIDDLAFQKYVFENAGYKINRCEVIYLNNKYTRKGPLDIYELFVREDVSLLVDRVYANVANNIEALIQIIEQNEEPEVLIHKTDPCKTCSFKSYCRRSLPEYLALNLFYYDRDWQKFYNQYKSYKVEDIPSDYKLSIKEIIDRQAYLTQQIHVEPQQIKNWLNLLEYPLYYLDYETAQLAIPLFDESKPYSQIPFQFSLHIQEKQGGELKHISFLHKEKTDPRRALAEYLVKHCGKKGSVVVYNQTFEKSRNAELADLFPDLRKAILAINDRIVDQLIPFRERALYHYKQHSSASIKHVLPAFTKLSYDDMEVHNGGEAKDRYLAFMQGKLTLAEEKALFDGLEAYCGQDTYAMVKLMDVLYKKAK